MKTYMKFISIILSVGILTACSATAHLKGKWETTEYSMTPKITADTPYDKALSMSALYTQLSSIYGSFDYEIDANGEYTSYCDGMKAEKGQVFTYDKFIYFVPELKYNYQYGAWEDAIYTLSNEDGTTREVTQSEYKTAMKENIKKQEKTATKVSETFDADANLWTYSYEDDEVVVSITRKRVDSFSWE